MTYCIEKDFVFSAAHHLDGLPAGHQCARVHGHNYVVRVRLTAPLVDEVGFVLDYSALSAFKDWLDLHLDHRDLNTALPEVENPTAENLAYHLAMIVAKTCPVPTEAKVSVGVSETPKTWAWFVQ